MYDILIIGAGAAGYFTAINIKEKNKQLNIAILEKGKTTLSKVKISGGGRCNVTNACTQPEELITYYPRGNKELRGPFCSFGTKEVVQWFTTRGITLKTETDGRIFPQSNTSETIVNYFTKALQQLNVPVLTQQNVESIKHQDSLWVITTSNNVYTTKNLVITTGSNPKIWNIFKQLGHQIIPPVPSLFTFTVPHKPLLNLMGIATPATLTIPHTKLQSMGMVLITHWGLSGPAVLKLSAFGARWLASQNYTFPLHINWANQSFDVVLAYLQSYKLEHPKKIITKNPLYQLNQRLWDYLLTNTSVTTEQKWADCSKKQIIEITNQLIQTQLTVTDKGVFKEEFVTAGGIALSEVNFKTMASKKLPNVYFAGEVLDIDAVTGGFNFQNAWTGSWIISEALSKIE